MINPVTLTQVQRNKTGLLWTSKYELQICLVNLIIGIGVHSGGGNRKQLVSKFGLSLFSVFWFLWFLVNCEQSMALETKIVNYYVILLLQVCSEFHIKSNRHSYWEMQASPWSEKNPITLVRSIMVCIWVVPWKLK